MKLTFYGGAGEVGRSCFKLDDGNAPILLDCGIKLGSEVEVPTISNEELSEIRSILVSHAHLDHIGYVPNAVSSNRNITVKCTKPTRDLAPVLLSDCARIGKTTNQDDVSFAVKKMSSVEYLTEHRAGGFKFEFLNAGHIMGSAFTWIKHGEKRILYTGDFNPRKSRILDGCVTGLKADTLILESTYGSRDSIIPSSKEEAKRLADIINETVSSGGKVLIPSFAVGRAQEILIMLDDYMRSGYIKKVPIYVDGMIKKVMRIYRNNAIYANDSIKRTLLTSPHDPFNSPNFKSPSRRDRSDVLDYGPCIIVSTSGMLTGGPAVLYLKRLANDERNSLVFVGYQSETTPGGKILNGEKEVVLDDETVEINLRVERVKISGHGDYNDLLSFASSGVRGVKMVILVHGDCNKDLKDKLEDSGKFEEVISPSVGGCLDVF